LRLETKMRSAGRVGEGDERIPSISTHGLHRPSYYRHPASTCAPRVQLSVRIHNFSKVRLWPTATRLVRLKTDTDTNHTYLHQQYRIVSREPHPMLRSSVAGQGHMHGGYRVFPSRLGAAGIGRRFRPCIRLCQQSYNSIIPHGFSPIFYLEQCNRDFLVFNSTLSIPESTGQIQMPVKLPKIGSNAKGPKTDL
jgi:hypothetical protein